MVDLNSTCKDCVHKDVCRYAKDFEIICHSLMEVANESIDKEYFQNLVDLKIHCKQYVMAPYQAIKSNQDGRLRNFNYDPLCQADLKRMMEKSGSIVMKEEL